VSTTTPLTLATLATCATLATGVALAACGSSDASPTSMQDAGIDAAADALFGVERPG